MKNVETEAIKQRFKKAKNRAIRKAVWMFAAGVVLTAALSFSGIQWMMVGFAFFLIIGTFAVRSLVEDFKRIKQAEKQQLDSAQDQTFHGFQFGN